MNALTFWQIVSYFGDVQYWIGLTVAVLIIYPLISRKDKHKIAWIVLALLPAVLISHQIVSVLKDALAVPRPCVGELLCPQSYSFPSGHAAVVFAFALVASCMTRKRGLAFILFVFAILVAISRVVLNYHYIRDVVAGALVGLCIGFLFYRSYKQIHSFLEKKKLIP